MGSRLLRRGMVLGMLLSGALWAGVGCRQQIDAEPQRQELLVFAAASLTDALEALADSFETAHPQYDVVLNVAATSLLARQIDQGAPADVFFSANPGWMAFLEEKGHVVGPIRTPIGNELVAAGRADAPTLRSVQALAQVKRLALADPEHVPAGIYAKEALVCAGLWEAVRTRVVPALDVRAALLAVQSGAADMALVYASDVRVDARARTLLTWPADCQPDIRYAVAVLRGASHPEAAQAFVRFAMDPRRVAFWRWQGFLPRLGGAPS